MGMPSEVRLHIFGNSLIKESAILVAGNAGSCPAKLRGRPVEEAVGPKGTTSILRVCRRAHVEAADLLYGKNVFVAHLGGMKNLT